MNTVTRRCSHSDNEQTMATAPTRADKDCRVDTEHFLIGMKQAVDDDTRHKMNVEQLTA